MGRSKKSRRWWCPECKKARREFTRLGEPHDIVVDGYARCYKCDTELQDRFPERGGDYKNAPRKEG